VSAAPLERNARALAATSDALERVPLLQDRAVLLARLGDHDASRAASAESARLLTADAPPCLHLRSRYVAAIQAYFSLRFDEANAQMRQALADARADCRLALVSECESALALFMQREGDTRGAVQFARAVLANAEATHESRYRALLTLASLHETAGDFPAAASLYEEMQAPLAALDDDIATASWRSRSACNRAGQLRLKAVQGELDKNELAATIEALRDSIAFASALASSVQRSIEHLVLAEMQMLAGRYDEALATYDAHLPGTETTGFLIEATVAIADRARCLLQLGRRAEAVAGIERALARLDETTPAEVRAIVHENAAAVALASARTRDAHQHEQLAQIAWAATRHEQQEARRLLMEPPR
jgi:tetratricopeptide (TPR) repeat protein